MSIHSGVFRNYGLPEEIVSDRGPQFISRVWKAFFRLLRVTVSLSSGYHPQTNGQTERRIQELGRYLRSYCHDDQHSWSRYLPWAEYAQNSLRQNTTGLTPFQCILGYQPRSSPGRESPRRFQLWTTGSERARECGTRLTSISSEQYGGIRSSQMSDVPLLPGISQETWCGCPPGIGAAGYNI